MKLLLIEDDPKISSYVSEGLERDGFIVDHFLNGNEGFTAAQKIKYDVAVVDLMLPDIDGFNLIANLRNSGQIMPVLILSAKRSVEDKVLGLKKGGDDYLTKPFSFEELLARVHALVRRSAGNLEKRILSYENLVLDKVTRRVVRNDAVIELQTREYHLLELLLSEPERVFSKNIILEKIWQYNFDPQTNVVDVLVCRLRSKIDGPFENKLIHTVRGVGYELRAEKTAN